MTVFVRIHRNTSVFPRPIFSNERGGFVNAKVPPVTLTAEPAQIILKADLRNLAQKAQ
jgi:hypothetical protein